MSITCSFTFFLYKYFNVSKKQNDTEKMFSAILIQWMMNMIICYLRSSLCILKQKQKFSKQTCLESFGSMLIRQLRGLKSIR